MPTRKGHNKSRSRRHRAWLHHKSGCGENFALRQACKTQEAERCSRESSARGDRVEQQRGNSSLVLGLAPEASQEVASLSPGQQEQEQSSPGTEARVAIFGVAAAAAAATEDTGPGKYEVPGTVHHNPSHSKEDSNENHSPAAATPKRTAKGNRRKKKGAGRGGGGRIRQGVDLAGKEEAASTDIKEPRKEEISVGTREQDSRNAEAIISTQEQVASTEDCCVSIAVCNSTQGRSSVPGDRSLVAGEETVNASELAAGTRECTVDTREPEGDAEKCSLFIADGGGIGTSGRGIAREGPNLCAEDPAASAEANRPAVGREEQSISTPGQGVDGTEGPCMGGQGPPISTEEATLIPLPKKKEPSADGREEALSTAANQGTEEAQNPPHLAAVHLGQAVDWVLVLSGVFALTGGMDRSGFPLLIVVPQPLRDELPPGQTDLVNTMRYLYSLLRRELKARGLTVLLDLSQVDDWALQAPVLLPAIRTFQESSPAPIRQLLVILPPDDRFVPHEEELALEPAAEVRVLSLPELPHYVALDQLTPTLGGTLNYSPRKWVEEHQALEQLQSLCRSVLQAVCEASAHLEAVGTTSSQEELSAQITLHQETMQKLLSEPRLLELQRRGGALLARLPPLGPCSTEAVAATRLYQEVDEALHGLVQLSNRRLEVLQQERENAQVQEQALENKAHLESTGNCVEEKREAKRPVEGLTEGASLERTLLQSPKSPGRMQPVPEASCASRPRACSISASSSPKHGWGLGSRFGSSCSLTSLFQPHSSPKASPCCSPTRSSVLESGRKRQGLPSSPKSSLSPISQLALRALSDPGRPSVHIRGLEVSSRELADRSCSPREHVLLSRSGTHVAEAPWGATPRTERRRCLGVQQQLLTELLECEREYLTALAQPLSLSQEPGGQAWPAELRCLGSALRALRDQLLTFHTSYFLGELEGCMNHPSRTGGCFLRHGEKFQLYATYAKEHHKFQAALALLRTTSKKSPAELREDGQTAHALRVPLEQLERYRRFLGELLRECELERGPDRQALQEAQQLLEAQEQRGRDLLAAEQIRGCEMKLSEQGPLLQRGELTVVCGRRKCQRHVFLFERLLLFTKCKGPEGGYVCKQALQTASMGLTESVGPSGLRFELWFGRGPGRQAYTLQAASAEVKHQWTNVIAQLLWRQAAHPSVSMNISSCPAQRLAPLGLGPGAPPGLSLPGHFEEEEWDLDVKPIPRAETSESDGPSPSHQELPRQGRGSLPGSSTALGHPQSSSGVADEPVTPL